MPDFTPEHFERLPREIQGIMNLQRHQALRRKRHLIISKGFDTYKDLRDSEKALKQEVLEAKRSIHTYMKTVGVLEVICQEVTID